ncbi:MAG: histidine kinase [Cellulomonadaceae bacterium]|nr:histidine kinase [Cellulomonadaceae bacterium]
MTAESPSGRGALRPRARLLRTLGNDLISSDKVALIELVKNAYDADAANVLVRFHGPLEQGRGRIEIWDDGHGMSVEALESSWLDIATDTKKKRTHSEGGRRVLGEKGIGRLAAARIGTDLLLTTRRAGESEVSLLIDWTQFDQEDAYLDEIEVAWEVGEPVLYSEAGVADEAFSGASVESWNSGRGTVLQISNLTRAWSSADLIELRTALTRLVRPRPTQTGAARPDFEIHVDLVDVPEALRRFSGPIDASSDFRMPHYRLTGSVDTNGSAQLHYTQLEPHLDENLETRQLWDDDKRAPQSGPFDFDLNVWDRDRQGFERTIVATKDGGVPLVAKDLRGFRSDLDDVAGISIYRDGFRVLPFGERDDDWLRLDLRRVQSPTRALSNNQIIGHIFIDADANQQLRDQSNREGLLEGAAYEDLRIMVRAALTVLENRRYAARRTSKSDAQPRGGIFERFDLGEIRGALAAQLPNDSQLIGLVDEKSRDIQAGVVEVQQILSRYSRLATLGSLIDKVLHDGRTVITQLKNLSRFGKRDLSKATLDCEEKISISTRALTRTAEQADLLEALFNQIEPFGGRRRGRPRTVRVRELVDRAITIGRFDADEKGVELTAFGEDFEVTLDESEVLTVLTNLIANAIYWTATRPKHEERKVAVGARRNSDSSVTIGVSDSGPGVDESIRELIFDPYFSSKPDGVGLGLSISGNLVEDIYAGELILVDNGPLSGATFEATFRRRV